MNLKYMTSFESLYSEVQYSWVQGRIYVANDYPTFARTTLMVCQKIRISRQNSLNRRENLSIWMKNMQILG